ncbi:MAG: hypothetical protein Q4G25_10420 [Paracoccus sp. (in: a-proteobacteria)]|nr:hypothetical protein [Paracoccus sp. (in: a-proteobacteria)]
MEFFDHLKASGEGVDLSSAAGRGRGDRLAGLDGAGAGQDDDGARQDQDEPRRDAFLLNRAAAKGAPVDAAA